MAGIAVRARASRAYRSDTNDPRSPLRSPEVSEPIRGQLGIAHRVLNIPMPKPSLERPRVVAIVRELVAASVAQHVRMDRKGHSGTFAQARDQRVEAFGCHRRSALGHKYIRASGLLALDPPQ